MDLKVIDRGNYHFVLAPQGPCWVAANAPGVELISDLANGGEASQAARRLADYDGLTPQQAAQIVEGCAQEAAALWEPAGNGEYRGRAEYMKPSRLRELWFHINNRCNFRCRHCLVSSGPDGDDGLPHETVAETMRAARKLGALTFFFTGGEPLLRKDIPDLLRLALEDPHAHAVVLTNGSLADRAFLNSISDLDRSRLHLQVSLDGSNAQLNDSLRSPRAFERTTRGIRNAVAAGIDTTIATVVLDANLEDLQSLACLLPELGVHSWHLMWQHLRERGAREPAAAVSRTQETVLRLRRTCAEIGVVIDNFENLKAIINGEPNTKRDGTNAGWDSLAVHADGGVYPSAALVGIPEFLAGSILDAPLEGIWRDSEHLDRYRRRSAVDCANLTDDPFLLLHGGGDPEHEYFHGQGKRCAGDPYLPMYETMMLDLADEIVAAKLAHLGCREDVPLIYHVMGQDGLGCPVDAGVETNGPHRIDFTHSNCVLMPDVVGHSREIVRDYYGEAAIEVKGEICCPVPVDRRALTHIPQEILERSYGCGSPVFAADVQPGETVVDLGCGGGIECFVASKLVGPQGRAIGVDMTPQMLALAESAAPKVAENLGYKNVTFLRGLLESLPLEDESADLMISNCVINLSAEKYKVFAEIFRVLKPGGRLVISDITAGNKPPDQIKFNPRLKGECIGGALTGSELLALLSKLGFADVAVLAHLPWREVGGVEFASDTVRAVKPMNRERPVPYIAHDAAISTGDGDHTSGCVVCGAPLQYLQTAVDVDCKKCGRMLRTRSRCAEGHFVCDQCHGGEYLRFVHSYLAQCEGTDPVAVFLQMRDAYPFPVHGPEHHALVPAAFLIAYHNLHGFPDVKKIWDAVETGAALDGGSCAFWGACSAALGIGVAFSAILEATPLSSGERGTVQEAVARILARIAELNAPRCCRRESLLSLLLACQLSGDMLPNAVPTAAQPVCDQAWANSECVGELCPFFPQD